MYIYIYIILCIVRVVLLAKYNAHHSYIIIKLIVRGVLRIRVVLL